jgi:hypothetical protein
MSSSSTVAGADSSSDEMALEKIRPALRTQDNGLIRPSELPIHFVFGIYKIFRLSRQTRASIDVLTRVAASGFKEKPK